MINHQTNNSNWHENYCIRTFNTIKYLCEVEGLFQLLLSDELEELELPETEREIDVCLEQKRVVLVDELRNAVHGVDARRGRRVQRGGSEQLAPHEHSQVDGARQLLH